ncbi:MAG TPA: heparan-alpha-glucosaminide N-acetyltransferase domain-containing protein [Gemmatimonadaceae bacterium]|nr:heparan-alpha-glucosaminide N-acetyltransferase domain-containing protein [Gemmatimonadaceae bacterium]
MSTTAREQVAGYAPAPATPSTIARRIPSLDLMRGVIMILMAIDHVRVYSGIPAGGPSPAIFFTRWVTHFCAPGFVFLAGTAAFLHGRKLGDRGALAKYLVIRGLLLVALELTLIRFSWTFNVAYSEFILAGVIWMLGWCMVILGALVHLSPKIVGWLGLGILMLQQSFGLLPRAMPDSMRATVAPVWNFFYPTGVDGPAAISILYVLVPWVGVMAAGYGFGLIMVMEPERRNRLLTRIGLAAIAFFLVVGGAAALADSGSDAPFLFRLLGQQKYPASQLFLAMTLGPMIALLPLAARARGKLALATETVGRVPMFYYLAHIPLIHLSALAVNAMRTGSGHQEWYATAPFASVPEEQRWPLWLLYAVFAVDVALLYVACRWYARVKAERPQGWMRFF